MLKGPDSPYWKGHGEISAKYWFNLRRHALARQLEITITIKDAWDLFLAQDRRCALSGVELVFGVGQQTASLDRVDPSRGYVPGNLQWVHKAVNFMKRDLTQDQFMQWCEKVLAHKGATY